jgi:hypothetical protein
VSFQIGYPRGDRFLSSVRLFSTRPLLIVVVSPVYVVGASVKNLILLITEGISYYLEVCSYFFFSSLHSSLVLTSALIMLAYCIVRVTASIRILESLEYTRVY